MTFKKCLICGLIFMVLCLYISGCIGGQGISVKKLDYIPKSYINITSEQLEEYPTMKKCISILNSDDYDNNVKTLVCSKNEIEKIELLFGDDPNDNYYDSDNFFKYQEKYYSLGYVSID